MIEINFLPVKYKKRDIQLPDFGKFKIIPVAVVFSLFLFGLYFILSMVSTVKTNTLNRLNKEWQSIAVQKEEADKLKGRMNKLKKKADLIDNLVANRLLWSRKLNQLSDLIIDNIWLESLALGERKDKRALILKGNVASRKKEETAIIGEFIQKLRGNTEFVSDFQEIELESIKRRKVGETEIMEFVLILFMVQAGY